MILQTNEISTLEIILCMIIVSIFIIIIIIWLICSNISKGRNLAFQRGLNQALLYKTKFDLVKHDIREYSVELKKTIAIEFHDYESVKLLDKLLKYLDNVY